MIHISKTAQQNILDEITKKQTDINPFVEENNIMYLRYDRIDIYQTETDKIIAEFWWRSTKIYTMAVNGDFSRGCQLSLTDLRGTVEIKVLRSTP